MSTLEQTTTVKIPFAQAADFVETFFDKQTEPKGEIVIPLVLSGAGIGIPGMTLQKDVRLTLLRERGPNESIVFALHWEPKGGGAYPDFDGTLSIEEDETYDTCILRLRGSYQPPLGLTGKIFDLALGGRIAAATAKELLQRLDGFLTRGYLEREQHKRLQILLRGA
ncbi:MAG: hypothetical protein JO263_00875 [Candidatus Eremiobacteraeota bacterium]|nr:hypothetical protein [Candidatus Eremiobacteraeota bacterium]